MYSVDESTEREILKNLSIREDELLKACNLDRDNSLLSLDEQALSRFPATEDQSFDDTVLDKLQRQNSYEYKPETQQLLRETRESLEKELSLFREINLQDPQQTLSDEELNDNPDIMQISSNNPKYINHARLDDRLLYK